MVVVRKFREEIAWFQHPTRWLSQVVFRNFAGVSAGVIFHPLGSTRNVINLAIELARSRGKGRVHSETGALVP